jgi:hypothetical protein
MDYSAYILKSSIYRNKFRKNKDNKPEILFNLMLISNWVLIIIVLRKLSRLMLKLEI